MNKETVFIIYAIAWVITGVLFTLLKKRTNDINKKKQLNLISGLTVSLLMFSAAILLGFPFRQMSIVFIIVLAVIFTTIKRTFYCAACGYEHNKPFAKIEVCPKCGAKKE
jgi:rubrerythrin